MKKVKRILAAIGAILLFGMYASTLLFALIDHSASKLSYSQCFSMLTRLSINLQKTVRQISKTLNKQMNLQPPATTKIKKRQVLQFDLSQLLFLYI